MRQTLILHFLFSLPLFAPFGHHAGISGQGRLEQNAQRGDGLMISKGFQEKNRCCTEWHRLEQSEAWIDGWTR